MADDTRIDVFDEPPAEETAEQVETEAVEEKGEESEEPEAKAEGESTDEAEEKPADPEPPSDIEKRIAGLEAAAAAERRRRQAAEDELRKARATQEAPDPSDDPEGFAAYQKAQEWQYVSSVSRKYAMKHFDDYEEVEAVFIERAQLDPKLVAEVTTSDDPAMFAYEKGKEFMEASKYMDPEARKAHDEAVRKTAVEPLEKRIAELEKLLKPDDDSVSATDLPNLTRATSAGSNTPAKEKPVETIEELFND